MKVSSVLSYDYSSGLSCWFRVADTSSCLNYKPVREKVTDNLTVSLERMVDLRDQSTVIEET